MSFIQFESAKEKERIREELRVVREELLKRAKKDAEVRAEKRAQKVLSGESNWMLPCLAKKIDKTAAKYVDKPKKSSKKKKEKKSKKDKKPKKKSKRKRSSSTSSSDSSDEGIIEKRRKKKRRMSTESSSSESSSTEEEKEGWVEKEENKRPLIRDDWMTSPLLLKTFSRNDNKTVKEKQHIDAYDPAKSSRELNPHWKGGGTGLPEFKKPKEEDEYSYQISHRSSFSTRRPTGSWKKTAEAPNPVVEKTRTPSPSSSLSSDTEEVETKSTSLNFLTDQQMNELGAKVIKAEIMGNNALAEELKKKLEDARKVREHYKNTEKKAILKGKQQQPDDTSEDHILLTTTDSKGHSRPLLNRSETESDRYNGRRGRQKNKKVETHVLGERVRYFPDDDKYDIKQMFEREKYVTAADSDAQFAEIAGRSKNPKDDLDDIFSEKVQKTISDSEKAEKDKQRAIHEHERLTKQLESCDRCFESRKMEKQLMVSMGKNVYLSIPWYEGLQANHCLIVPISHISCSTQLDEDTWEEISDFRKALTRMFAAHKKDVIFFEMAHYLHKRPHMVIHCVPADNLEMAPFYFKKAIQESEYEWSTNKQLVSLKDKGLRRAIPRGLPYFWVNFGMDNGFAHVIEDQERFPSNFAQEIIGGMLHLDSSKWRRPRKEHNIITKVKNLADWWKPYDITE